MTKREKFEHILTLPGIANDEIAVETLRHEIELLDKKSEADKKPTAKQIENEGYAAQILDWMEPNQQYLSSDVAKNCPVLVENGIKIQRVTPMLTNLVKQGKLVSVENKRKTYYSLA